MVAIIVIELDHNEMSTCAQKVRIVLAEKDLDWTGHHMDLRAGDTLTPEYLKLNPAGVVPTLVDDGCVVVESNIIMEYLDDQYPALPLRPVGATEKARMRLWNKQLDDSVHAATSVISTGIAFRHQHAEKTPEQLAEYLQRIPDSTRRERVSDLIANGVQSPAFGTAILRFRKLLDDLEATLSHNTWLAGDEFSLAEAGIAPYMTRLEHLQLGEMIEQRKNVTRWIERIKSRSSYSAAVGKWLNDKYLLLMEEKGREVWPEVNKILLAA